MNILYFCNADKARPLELGVFKKICSQCKVLREEGHCVFLGCYDGDSFSFFDKDDKVLDKFDLSNIGRIRKYSKIYKKTLQFVKANHIKVVYCRFADFSLEAYFFFKKIKKGGGRVLLEIPTYPMKGQLMNGIHQSIKAKHYVQSLKQLYFVTIGMLGVPLFRYCIDRIVNNNGFERIWGLPVLMISNGVDVKAIPKRHHIYEDKKNIIIGAVANVAPWHGYDRVLTGLFEYYKEKPERVVSFELGGPGSEVELLKNKANELNITNYVKFLGVLSGVELDAFFDRIDVGISLLGVHRSSGVRFDSLKSREYSARCLPFVTQSEEYIFKDKPFVIMAPSDESPLDINKVLDFYDKIVETPSLINELKRFATERCDWSYTFKPVLEYINNIDE